jgi:hypothetical protein
MSSLLVYLLETSGVLLILYTLYWLLLRRLTFFSFNRFFLLGSLLLSFLFPLLSFDLLPSSAHIVEKPISELRDMRMSYHQAFEAWPDDAAGSSFNRKNSGQPNETTTDSQSLLLTLGFVVYGIGLMVVIFRLVWSYCWILKLKNSAQKEVRQDLTVVKVPQQIAPFSFLNSVFVSQELLQSEDLEQILAHEKIHLQERHSLDLIFVQVAVALLWFNPVVWQLLKSLKATHEYIADKKTINQGYSLVRYQTLLLRQLISVNAQGLIHNFNLSFIKKRISMMTIQKSGWAGKAKVALALCSVFAISLLMMQCNATLDEQVLTESTSGPLAGDIIDVPILPQAGNRLELKPDQSLNLSISGNEIFIEGEAVALKQVAVNLSNSMDKDDMILLQIDHQQRMGLVREVQGELRKADRRKIVYLGQTVGKEQVEVPILLPPAPGNEAGIRLPKITDAYAQEHNLGLLKVKMGEKSGTANEQEVYDFVKRYVEQQSPDYVVTASYEDNATFEEYLLSLYHLKEGFHQIYEERAQELYGKPFSEISQNRSSSEEYQAMYEAIRKNIPMAISIAED